MNEKIWKDCERIQKEFVYDKIVDENGVTVYHCHKPGTNVYSFDIVITQRSIFVNGDIDCLVWDFKNSLEFLAGNDIDYYIYQKLANIFHDQLELDVEARDNLVDEMLKEDLIDNKQAVDLKQYGDLQEASMELYQACGHFHEYGNITKPAFRVVFPMYMACYAARKILGE